MRSSSSTVRNSPIRWPSACAAARPTSPSSIMSRRACGPGALAGAQDAPLRRPHPRHPAVRARGAFAGSADQPAAMSAIRWSRSSTGSRSSTLKPCAHGSASRPDRAVLVVLPGSRTSEVKRLMAPFGDALRLLQHEAGPFEVILPAVAQRPRPRSRPGARHLAGARRTSSAVKPTNSRASSSPARHLPPPAP